MESKRKLFLYVSGPPCAGKSTVSQAIIRRMKSIKYVLGDEVWIRNEHNDFNVRIEKTNKEILSSVEKVSSDKVLLEWVPSYGSFVDKLKSISISNKYEFIHIVITAPREILEKRKMNRDGERDLGPVNLSMYATLKNVILFDTSVDSTDEIVSKCISVLNNKY